MSGNAIMLYTGKPGGEVAKAMAKEKIFIGGDWPQDSACKSDGIIQSRVGRRRTSRLI